MTHLSVLWPKGTRVRLNHRGKGMAPKTTGRIATVVGYSRDGEFLKILFDEHKTKTLWHPCFLQRSRKQRVIQPQTDESTKEQR